LAVNAVRKVDLKPPVPLTVVHHLIYARRAEILARIAILPRAPVNTDVSVQNFQMAGLVFIMLSTGIIDIRQFGKGQLVVVLEIAIPITLPCPVKRLELLHMFVTGLDGEPRRKATAGDRRHSSDHQPGHPAAVERLMKVSGLVEFAADVTLLYVLLKDAEPGLRMISGYQRIQNRFSSKHARLYCRMNSLEAFAIEHPGRIADHHHPIRGHSRHGIPAANGHGFCAIADELAVLQQLTDERMSLEFLKLVLGVYAGIAV